MSVRLLQTPDARYVIGAMVSWLVYGALYIAMLNVVTHYAVASGISWYSLMALSMRSKNMARSVL